jgi:hypothetical protein
MNNKQLISIKNRLEHTIKNFNEDDMLDSALEYAKCLNELASHVFLRDKGHVMMFFILHPNRKIELIAEPNIAQFMQVAGIPAEHMRQVIHQVISGTVQHNNSWVVAHISEGYTYMCKDPNNDAVVNAMKNEGLRLKDLGPEHRREILQVSITTKHKDSIVYLSEIVRNGDEVSLKEPDLCTNPGSEGAELGFFQDFFG